MIKKLQSNQQHSAAGEKFTWLAVAKGFFDIKTLLASLAYISPRIVEAIADGRAPRGITVSTLARDLPFAWAQQERQFGLHSNTTQSSQVGL